jgi:hypothetical protein
VSATWTTVIVGAVISALASAVFSPALLASGVRAVGDEFNSFADWIHHKRETPEHAVAREMSLIAQHDWGALWDMMAPDYQRFVSREEFVRCHPPYAVVLSAKPLTEADEKYTDRIVKNRDAARVTVQMRYELPDGTLKSKPVLIHLIDLGSRWGATFDDFETATFLSHKCPGDPSSHPT